MIERSIAFGPGGALVGTVCLPSESGRARLGQILFNAGVVHRVGPHRINVRLARNLAKRGIPSLRFDLSGLGDSARPSGNLSYEDQAVADVRLAMDTLGAETGLDRFALFGFCSGGVHTYAAALADTRVDAVMIFDAFQYPTFKTRLNSYRARARRRGLLKALVGWTSRHAASLPARVIEVLRRKPGKATPPEDFPPKLEFARGMKTLHDRGVRLAFLYSTGFEAYFNYAEQFQDSFRGLGVHEMARCEYLPAMDHTALLLSTQADFLARIEEFVSDANDRGPVRGS